MPTIDELSTFIKPDEDGVCDVTVICHECAKEVRDGKRKFAWHKEKVYAPNGVKSPVFMLCFEHREALVVNKIKKEVK